VGRTGHRRAFDRIDADAADAIHSGDVTDGHRSGIHRRAPTGRDTASS
jgi:hypothetical protein